MSLEDVDSDERRTIRINVSDPSLLLIPVCAASFGFVSGLLSGGKKSSLQFLAENAHRQPTTLQGWYFYNKTKNYRVALGAGRNGAYTAARLAIWTSAFVAAKEAGHRIGLGKIETGGASGTLLAVLASAIYKLPRRTLSKRLLLGFGIGALTGALQDARDRIQVLRQEQKQLDT